MQNQSFGLLVAQETIESSIGMAMIYSVTEACQDRKKLSCMSGAVG